MNRLIVAALAIGVVFVVGLEVADAATGQVPRGAFLRKPVGSVEELAQQCVSDPVVRKRFAQHFGIRPEELGKYIQDNVVITKVTANTPRRVYIVTRSGRVVHQRQTLKRGDHIFALKDTGEPLLVLACGNPVVKELPPRVKVETKTLPSYQVLRPNEVPMPPPLAAVPPLAEAPPAEIVTTLPPALAPPTPIAAVPAVPGRARFPWFIPPIIIGANGGDGGGQPPPPIIPEPGGAAAVAATVLIPGIGFGMRKLRARRS